MKIPLARAFAFIALAALIGCVGSLDFETEERKPAFVRGQLEDLIGTSKEKVKARLGHPKYELLGENESYFIYQEWVNAAGIIFVPLPFPVWRHDIVFRCSMLEFDDDALVSRFELTDPVHFKLEEQGVRSGPENCLEAFWTDEELAEFWDIQKAEIERLAHKGDPEAMYEYAYSRKSNVEAWKWICLAAHGGYGEARWRLGLGYRVDYVGPEQSLVLAYVWYALSSEAGYAKAKRYMDRLSADMSPAQIAEAERLVAEWEPNPAECDEIAAQVEH